MAHTEIESEKQKARLEGASVDMDVEGLEGSRAFVDVAAHRDHHPPEYLRETLSVRKCEGEIRNSEFMRILLGIDTEQSYLLHL